MKFLPALLLFLLSGYGAHAQDSIRTVTGKVIAAKIESVGPYRLTYYKYRSDPRYANRRIKSDFRKLSVSEVVSVTYADGRRDSVLPRVTRTVDTFGSALVRQYFYNLGDNNARLYYRHYQQAANGTLVSTFPGSPMLGLVVALSTSTTPPKPKNFIYPNRDLLASDAYKQGYAKKAHRMKAGAVWKSWGIGVLFTGLVVAAVTTRW